jgi:hypothetical protein
MSTLRILVQQIQQAKTRADRADAYGALNDFFAADTSSQPNLGTELEEARRELAELFLNDINQPDDDVYPNFFLVNIIQIHAN